MYLYWTNKLILLYAYLINLFMDNVGRHSTKLAKLEYTDILKSDYNINIEWQVIQSPETNILDLGVWCLLQSLVEYLHQCKRMKEDSLAQTIEWAWELVNGSTKFHAVYERWKKVLSLILLGGGGNLLAEKCRDIRRSLDDITVLLAAGGVVDGVDLNADDEYDEGAESKDNDYHCEWMGFLVTTNNEFFCTRI